MAPTGPDFNDRQDFEDADRGFIARLEPGRITDEDGKVVWDADAFAFLDADCPETVHPSLWRQGQLCARQGLFEVCEGVYQVRGLDISNMSLIEGDTGVVVVDPLISVETAAAAIGLYREHRGDRPVTAVVYTHSHGDHFGGVGGVTDGSVPIVAPAGFMEHAVSENVYAGVAMTRRASYMYGTGLPYGPDGIVGLGLGNDTSHGTISLFPPTIDVTRTGQEETLDGVRFVFQLTPGTEAPSELNFMLPERRALCMAENATHNLHNVLTLRGAEVRDTRNWARYLTESIRLFAADADVEFASHHWPVWGTERIVAFLSEQRDLYAYLHDQTLRLLNQGHTGPEIAERFELPPKLDAAWHARGYYGSVSHDVKAIYQRYLGWFDGNPASLWAHPPVESAKRYVDCIGGIANVLSKADEYRDAGDLRFAAQLLQQAVFTDPEHAEAKERLAAVYERLGHGSENATWRNFYLTGAYELRHGVIPQPIDLSSGMAAALSIDQLFDTLAIRVDAARCWDETIAIDWHFTDTDQRVRTTLRNGVLVQEPDPRPGDVDLTMTLTKPQFLGLLAGKDGEGIAAEGDADACKRLLGHLDEPDPGFAIVTP